MTRNLFTRLLDTGRKLLRVGRRAPRPTAGLRLEALEERALLSSGQGRPDMLEPTVVLELDESFQRQTLVRQQHIESKVYLFVEPLGLSARDSGEHGSTLVPQIELFAPLATSSPNSHDRLFSWSESHETATSLHPAQDVLAQVAYWTAPEHSRDADAREAVADQWSPFLAPLAVAAGAYVASSQKSRKKAAPRQQTFALSY